MDRSRLRARLRRARAALDADQRRRAAAALNRRISRLPVFLRARRIAFYAPTGCEVDVWPLLQAALDAGKEACLPVLRSGRMAFVPYRTGDPLRRGAFGIREPAPGRAPVARRSLDLAVVPLIGFDPHGARLGQGGGHYDRYFASHIAASWRRPVLVGAAFEVQRCKRIDTCAWDVRLDLVVTETRVFPTP